MKQPDKQWLEDAIKSLKARGIIKRDKEVADKTGYSDASISNMLAGRVAVSEKFKRKFYEVFGEDKSSDTPLESAQDKYIASLEETVRLQKEMIEILKEKLAAKK